MNIPISTRFDSVKGKDAWRQNLSLASLVFGKVSSSLGPKGAYKMVTYNRGPEQVVKISKDPVPVLEELGIQHPAIAVIAEAAKMQREESGDGVIEFIILLSRLLAKADEMKAMGIHPSIIIGGYLEATKRALEVIDGAAMKVGEDSFDGILECVDCRRGLLTPDLRKMIIDASMIVLTDGRLDKDKVRIVRKPGGKVGESRLIRGVIVKSEKAHPGMPDVIEKPRITIMSGGIGIKRLEVKMRGEGTLPITLNIRDPAQIARYREAELKLNLASMNRIRIVGANVVICEQQICDALKEEFAKEGMFALEKIDEEGAKAVSDATGAEVIGNVDDLSEKDLGYAERLEVGKIVPEKVVEITGCGGATFLLRGSTSQSLDEIEQIVRNSMTVMKHAIEDGRVVPGGGAMEKHISDELRSHSLNFPNRKQLAIDRFADALEEIPRRLAINNGLNSIDVLAELDRRHAKGLHAYGVGGSGCSEMVSIDLAKVKISAIRRAYEVATLMLRIDELLTSKEMVKFHKR